MPRLSENTLVTSPSFLQSVLAGSVEADISVLHVEVKELEKNVQHLTVQSHKDLEGRYINFDRFDQRDGDYLQTAQKYIEDMQSLSSRIADGQIKTDVEDSAQELSNLQSALNHTRSMLSVLYQLLNIDCALQTVKTSTKLGKYLEAASCYSKIPPMFEDQSETCLYPDLFDGLKKECIIQCQTLSTILESLWGESLSWNTTGQSLSSKTEVSSLKMMKDPRMDTIDMLSALHFVGSLESTLFTFGSSLLEYVLTPILTAVTGVVVKDTQDHTLLLVEVSLSNDKPSLAMVAANLKIIFDFIDEQLNVDLDSNATCLSILGAFVSLDFAKILLKECLITSSREDQEQDFSQGLEELNELVEYLSDSGFLHNDNLTHNVAKWTKLSVNNIAFWESAAYLKRARVILKKDINETFFVEENFQSHFCNGQGEGDMTNSVDCPDQIYAFPACRISKWIVELINLIQEVLGLKSSVENGESDHHFGTGRRIFEMYAAIGRRRRRQLEDLVPLEIALYYNNSMFLAQNFSRLGFDDNAEKYSKGRKVIALDLIQRIKAMAVESLLDCLKEQRNKILEKTKTVDVGCLKTSSANLEKVVKECLLVAENLRSAWKGVLPDKIYTKAIGGIVNAWLEELMNILQSAGNVPANISRNIKVAYKVVADSIPGLLEVPTGIGLHVSRWSEFEKLVESRFAVENN